MSDAEDEQINNDRQYVKGQLALINAVTDKENVINIFEEADMLEESEDDK